MTDTSDPIKLPKFGIFIIASFIALILALPLIPVNSNRLVEIPPFNEMEGDYALVYFGYPGCGAACPTTLAILRQVYEQAQGLASLNVAFVNLMPWLPGTPSEKLIQLFHQDSKVYAKNFHPDFEALLLKPHDMEQAKVTFGLNFSEPNDDGIISHQGFTYLMKKQENRWHIKVVYTEGAPSTEQVLENLHALEAGQNDNGYSIFFKGLGKLLFS